MRPGMRPEEGAPTAGAARPAPAARDRSPAGAVGHARVCRATRRPQPAGPGVQWGGAQGCRGGHGPGSSGDAVGQLWEGVWAERGFLESSLQRPRRTLSAAPPLHSWHPQPPFPRGSRSNHAPCLDLLLRGGRPAVTSLQVLPGRAVTRKSVKIFWDSGPRGCDPRLGRCSPRSLRRCRPGLGAGEGGGCRSATSAPPQPPQPTLPPQGQQACFWSSPSARPAAGHPQRVGSARRPGPSGLHRMPDVGNPDAHPQGVGAQEGQTGRGAPGGSPGETLGPGQPQTQSLQTASSEDLVLWPTCQGPRPEGAQMAVRQGSLVPLSRQTTLTGPPGTECPGRGSLKALECHVLGLKGKQHNL